MILLACLFRCLLVEKVTVASFLVDCHQNIWTSLELIDRNAIDFCHDIIFCCQYQQGCSYLLDKLVATYLSQKFGRTAQTKGFGSSHAFKFVQILGFIYAIIEQFRIGVLNLEPVLT